MRKNGSRCALGAIFLAVATGCGASSGGSAPRPAPTQSATPAPTPSPTAPPPSLYVAGYSAEAVDAYAVPNQSNGLPKCENPLPSYYVYGIGVNAAHVLYVPLGDSGTIVTFGPDCGKPGPTLQDPGGQPADVAFDNTNGTVYVADLKTNLVLVYENGATTPTRTLSYPSLSGAYGVAVDRQGNVFESGARRGTIAEYPGGQLNGARLLPITGLSYPTGLQVDRTGNLIVGGSAVGVLVYAPPYSGGPSETISVTGLQTGYSKLDADNRNLYIARPDGAVEVHAYPSGTYEYTITNGLESGITGVAVDPPSN